MQAKEKKDSEEFLSALTEPRHRLFNHYLVLYDKEINAKTTNYRHSVTKNDMVGNAVMAISDMFAEVELLMSQGYFEDIHLKPIFNRFFARYAKISGKESKSISQLLKEGTAKGFYKMIDNSLYDGYLDETVIADVDTFLKSYSTEDLDKEKKGDMVDLVSILEVDRDKDEYKDLIDKFVNKKTFLEIANNKRNNGITKQAVCQRLTKYVSTIKEKIKQMRKFERYFNYDFTLQVEHLQGA